jgi:hypothetical protein
MQSVSRINCWFSTLEADSSQGLGGASPCSRKVASIARRSAVCCGGRIHGWRAAVAPGDPRRAQQRVTASCDHAVRILEQRFALHLRAECAFVEPADDDVQFAPLEA